MWFVLCVEVVCNLCVEEVCTHVWRWFVPGVEEVCYYVWRWPVSCMWIWFVSVGAHGGGLYQCVAVICTCVWRQFVPVVCVISVCGVGLCAEVVCISVEVCILCQRVVRLHPL